MLKTKILNKVGSFISWRFMTIYTILQGGFYMAMNISGLGNTYNGINTNSKQYKALKEKGWLSGIMQNEAMMSPEERMIYETFGGRDTII